MQLEIWEMKTAGIVLIVAMLSFIHKTNGFRAFGAGTRQVVSRFMASAESETSEKETGHQTGGAAGMPELSDQDKVIKNNQFLYTLLLTSLSIFSYHGGV